MVTMQSWMFLSSYEAMREKLLTQRTIQTMAHLGARAFGEISGEVVQTTAFVLQGRHFNGFKPVFFRLVDGQEAEKEAALRTNQNRFDTTVQDDFKKIPGSPVAYWSSQKVKKCFSSNPLLGEAFKPIQGLITGDTDRFAKLWFEVSLGDICFNAKNRVEAKDSGRRWFPYNKGGEYRRWFGNRDFVVDWQNDGERLKNFKDLSGKQASRTQNEATYFRDGVTWTAISSSYFAARYSPEGAIASNAGMMAFCKDGVSPVLLLGFLNSNVANHFVSALSETINYDQGIIARLPVAMQSDSTAATVAIKISEDDWNSFETSWGFKNFPWIFRGHGGGRVGVSWGEWRNLTLNRLEKLLKTIC
jgi:hypothetical protein